MEIKNGQILSDLTILVEHRGVEPLTSTMRMSRATNCANAPFLNSEMHYSMSPRFMQALFTNNNDDILLLN